MEGVRLKWEWLVWRGRGRFEVGVAWFWSGSGWDGMEEAVRIVNKYD